MTKPATEIPSDCRIAVIGCGVAGLTAAYLLDQKYHVDLFEKNDYIGGHTCTLTVPAGPDEGTPVDAGFIVMNHQNYPLFTKLLEQLGVELGDSDMSFGFTCKKTGYSYAGTNLNTLFAQRKNLFNGQHWRMIADILRFNRNAVDDLNNGTLSKLTLGEYIDMKGYGKSFAQSYLLAMGSAIWSSPSGQIRSFPAESFIHFFHNHGLLGIKNRPQWRYVRNGSRTYVDAVLKNFRGQAHTGQKIRGVERKADEVLVHFDSGETSPYAAVVLAAHADESLSMLDDPSIEERRLLGAWSYQENDAVFHSDPTIMPSAKRAWASWNFLETRSQTESRPVSVTYHMNRLQKLNTVKPYFVSLNSDHPLDDKLVWEQRRFTHPVYDFAALGSQSCLPKLNGVNRTWFCGSYFGYGFHEDAVRSGVQVAEDFGVSL